MSVTNLSKSHISPVILLLFSFIIISFFWIAVPFANAGNGALCTDSSCQFSAVCQDSVDCCESTPCPDGDCFWTGIECVPLSSVGACCLSNGECAGLPGITEVDCVSEGGVFQGEGTNCDPNPCPQPPSIPTLNQWGMIIMSGVLGLFAVIGLFVMRRSGVVKPSN